jgi:very-long-chain (3R)-3-hydroxyacyl-CoA dehydratase
MFALAYKGMHNFKPLEVFEGPTSNAVMAMLLINDIRNPLSVANPEKRKLRNPMELFAENSFHGGAWRGAYKYGTVGVPSALTAIANEYLVKYWLVLYNLIQTVGWGFALSKVCEVGMTGNVDKMQAVWSTAGSTIAWFQMFAIMEVVHAASGMVRSDPVMTAVQVYSRVLLVYVSNLSTLPQSSIWHFLMCFAWTLTETIRYPFLGLNGLGIKLAPLTWCRYSFFIILYPMGVSGELGTIWTAWKDLQDYKGYSWVIQSLQMLNNTGLGFIPIAVVYAIGLPLLYGGLLATRKKVLGTKKEGVDGKKKKQ